MQVRSPSWKHSFGGQFARLRVAFTLFCLLAFSAQTYLTQTHIHRAGEPAAIDLLLSGKAFSADQKQVPAKAPQPGDPDNSCPLYQLAHLNGACVTPAAAALLAPNLAVSVIQLAVQAVVTVKAVGYNWRGRAPPQH